MNNFAEWLSRTAPSVFIQDHEVWMIPTIQSIHIVGIGAVLGSALMITLRVLGWAGMDQSLMQNQRRFGPWLTGSLALLLVTGVLMVIGEPVRELVTFSFWAKMSLVVVITLIATAFQIAVKNHEAQWEGTWINLKTVKWAALGTFLIWAAIIFLGRFIAYDHVWGHWSPATKA